jgi:hypothetical protein
MNPPDDATLGVPLGEAASLEPALHTVGTAESALNFVRLSGLMCAVPGMDHAREAVRNETRRCWPKPSIPQPLGSATQIAEFALNLV